MDETNGTTQVIADVMDPARAHAMHSALGLPGEAPTAGDVLPPFWHQIYFWFVQPASGLGPDGHPRVGSGLIPDPGLPQRMWAGGQLEFHAPVILGRPAEKRARAGEVVRKTGRSGPLGFVTVTHEILQDGRLCVTERQEIVYRGPLTAPADLRVARTDEQRSVAKRFDTTVLFRYSALTMNGHRIHYDQDYASHTEGYPGLVVHGPLLAQLLIHLAEEELGPIRRFGFRAVSALSHEESAEICIRGNDLWVRGPDGRLCMEARAD